MSIKKIAFKTFKIIGITIISLIVLLFGAPFFFPQRISNEIKKLAKNSFTTEVNFSKARLSFFNHFPSLTLTLYDFSLKGSAPFASDTLVNAKEVSLGINIPSLFSKKIDIDELYLTQPVINVQVDFNGNPDYNVYRSAPSKTNAVKDSSEPALKIDKIIIEKSSITYNDRSLPMYIKAAGFEYQGKGDLSKAIFDLTTHAEIADVDFIYGGQKYFISKKLVADLVTRINTNSLAFEFEKNDIKINQLPFTFKGNFSFLKNGYNMFFKLSSDATELHDVFTALPPDYLRWLDKTDIKGTANISAQLSGNYVAATNTNPDLKMNISIRNGYIANNKTPSPVDNLFLNFETSLPGLNPDSLYVNIDSIYFNIDKDYFSSVIKIKGVKEPYIRAKINSEIDLEKWDKAIGLSIFHVKGLFKIHATADGKYATSIVKKFRGADTAISSVPNFTVQSSLTNGYFKYNKLPQALNNISFNISSSLSDNKYQHIVLAIDNINANVLDNYIKGFIKLKGGDDYAIDADLKSKFNLGDVKHFYPLDSLELKGNLFADIVTKGNYNTTKKTFPKTTATLSLKDGAVKTKYYPHPIEDIQVASQITNTDGTLSGTKMNVQPASFIFEKQPFAIQASLDNFTDLQYDITSKGVLDISRIYKVFAISGINANGFVETNLSLKGKQSDATNGHYDRLKNSGTLKVRGIALEDESFPLPFYIKSGLFRFQQDKMWFDVFKANYGKTDITLNGNLQNVINYALQQNAVLKGKLDLKSNKIVVDEFMAFADSSKAASPGSEGVIIVPANLDLGFTANAAKVFYNGLQLDSVHGNMHITNGKIILKEAGFNIIGASANMDAMYTNITPAKAAFSYHVTTKDFDVQRAYKEIKLFHDLASSAASAKGIISLDYTIQGKLNDGMMPVYPSLEGGGVLSVKDVKIKGLRLFGAVSKASGKDSIDNPDLSKIDFKSTIKNNIITLAKTKMKVFGFRPKIQGQVSFDGKLNLKFRLGLPPFGIFGIPMTITGTQANPKVKVGRGDKDDELKETEDKDQR